MNNRFHYGSMQNFNIDRRRTFRPSIRSQWLLALAALYFTTVLNTSLWRYFITRTEITGLHSFLFTISMPVFIFTAIFLFLNLLSAYTIKPILIILLLVSGSASYFMSELGIFIDADMIRNIFETNTREAFDLITIRTLFHIFLFGMLPSIALVFTTIKYHPFRKETLNRLIAISGCICLIGLIASFFYQDYAGFSKRHREMTKLVNPSNYLYGMIRYFHLESLVFKTFMPLDKNAMHVTGNDSVPAVFILVVGETARAANFSLNGYSRDTNPLLARENVIAFQDVYSCGTATAISVPCMFSNLSQKTFSIREFKFSENLMDLFRQTGFDVLWLENDDGCKGVCNRISTRNVYKSNDPRYCDGQSCFDEILLDNLEEYIASVKKDTFIVLHTIGSHGPTYYKRYPETFHKFRPTCDTADIQNCTREEIINTYDNTVLYTDSVVSRAIGILKKFPHLEAGLLYVSDHGESLGENNIYLHGLPYSIAPDEQKKIPMILWMSDTMKKLDHLDYGCIARQAREKTWSHDNLFHTLLALMEIRSSTYDRTLDIFDSCRTKPLP